MKENKEQENKIIAGIIQAQIGTREQHDVIQEHMDEYFKRWPSYKSRLTNLEWYHLFLDFYERIDAHPSPTEEKRNEGMIPVDVTRETLYKEIERLQRERNYLASNLSVWIRVSDELPPENTIVWGFSEKWIDEDFNPEGVRECHYNDGDWNTAKWVNEQDNYWNSATWMDENDGAPSHWMQLPAPPSKLIQPSPSPDKPEQ